ncbi:MAG: metallophosphoesterase [Eudoraea sp.]|uniref:metallophosphoesterase family protein n=1 Tax=Eudoraea sp. TaxID=1979955 RepID=UPI0032665B43
MKSQKLFYFKTTIIALAITMLSGCTQTTQETNKDVSAFIYDEEALLNAKPWTSKDFQNKPENFQFAIIGDRTGGANALGTFNLAMDQINLLQPEFVINVGDLIEGYPESKGELDVMWDEADSMISKLQMPFFYTIGNHDVSTPETKEAWLERRGVDYYYFLYNDVLFIVLNSEDDSRPAPPPEIMEGIKIYNKLQLEDPEAAKEMLKEFMSDEAVIAALAQPVEFLEKQMNWIKKTLAENADVRWTFLFLHEPCWENPSESFKVIQSKLKSRNHTLFAGHLHYYDYDNIDGYEHITMGPAGSSFHHDGPGNVDHIMWVTMTDDGPQMGNIALKGLFDRRGLDTTMFGAYDRKGY